MIHVRSKLLVALALYIIGSSIWFAINNRPSSSGEEIYGLIQILAGFAVGIGLLLNKMWAFYIYIISAAASLFFLIYNGVAAQLEAGAQATFYIMTVLILFVPGILIWIRRDRLDPIQREDTNA